MTTLDLALQAVAETKLLVVKYPTTYKDFKTGGETTVIRVRSLKISSIYEGREGTVIVAFDSYRKDFRSFRIDRNIEANLGEVSPLKAAPEGKVRLYPANYKVRKAVPPSTDFSPEYAEKLLAGGMFAPAPVAKVLTFCPTESQVGWAAKVLAAAQ